MTSSSVLAVIPARYGSKRFPGKPLALINGQPMVAVVMKRAAGIRGVDEVVVATDDSRIENAVMRAGGTALITSGAHLSGTSRVAEAAAGKEAGIVVNIQGDEPLLPREGVRDLIRLMKENPGVRMGTLASFTDSTEGIDNPDIVKVVIDRFGKALYFSRSPIPHSGDGYHRHIGIYAYRREFLLKYAGLAPGPLEETESLEQLRALENGYEIRVVVCRAAGPGVDRPEDIKRVEKLIDRV